MFFCIRKAYLPSTYYLVTDDGFVENKAVKVRINVIFWSVRVNTFAVEKHYVLHIPRVCL